MTADSTIELATTKGPAPKDVAPGEPRWASMAVPVALLYLASFVGAHLIFLRTSLYQYAGPASVDYSSVTFDNFVRIFSDGFYRGVITETLTFALRVVVGCLVLAMPVAYVVARSRMGRGVLVLILISMFTNNVVKILGLKVLLGGAGPIHGLLDVVGVPWEPRLVGSMSGAVIGQVQNMLPFAILIIAPVISGIHRNLEQAAVGLGASWRQVFSRVLLPLSTPGIVSASVVIFAISAGSFTAPALLGGTQVKILPIMIREQMSAVLDYPFAAALSAVLLITVSILLYVAQKVGRRKEKNSGATG
jgi:putative spermidine/putrescine transport system permease protein